MRRCFVLTFLLLTQVLSSHANIAVDYTSFNSLQEVIEYETHQIAQANPGEHNRLSDLYAARAESYLIGDDYKKALADFQSAYDYACLCQNNDEKLASVFRSLFGGAIVYGILGDVDTINSIGIALQDIMNSIKCHGCHDNLPIMLTSSSPPLLGPDRISIKECRDIVEGTTLSAKALIIKAKPEAQFLLNILIDDLSSRADKCCRAGGLWKGCVQPLVDKWYQWNQKWKLFGIPPDPAWD